jgi:replicative superfamily II helicase
MSVIGITSKKVQNQGKQYLKDEDKMVEVVVEKLTALLGDGHQCIVFVNSRSETVSTAKKLIKRLDGLEMQVTSGKSKNHSLEVLKFLVDNKFGVHHAGLPRNMRLDMEKMLRNGEINVLVSTSTLAWGVNLPAHAVIIKGTTFHNPDSECYMDLGILDILQIFGRAGRPQYDTIGEAYLITTGNKLKDYLSLLKNQILVESKLLNHMMDLLNSEIYLNTISNVRDALVWLKSTFMFVRMLKTPMLYGFPPEEVKLREVNRVLTEYVVIACRRLEECNLIDIYDPGVNTSHDYNLWEFQSTEYGRIGSMYYLNYLTVKGLIDFIPFLSNEDSILRILLKSSEFKAIILRSDEVWTLKNYFSDYGLEFTEDVECKLYVLIYLYKREIPIHHFSLICDQNFIVKTMRMMFKALQEILLYERRFDIYRTCLILGKKIERQRMTRMKRIFKLDATRLKGYLELSVSVDSDENVSLFVYEGTKIIYGTELKRKRVCFFPTTHHSLRVEIIGIDMWWEDSKDIYLNYERGMDRFLRDIYVSGMHSCKDVSWSFIM